LVFSSKITKLLYMQLLTIVNIVLQVFKNSDMTIGTFRLIDIFSTPFYYSKNAVLENIMYRIVEDP